ncbi:MAG: hypothetical protein IH987_20810 [Planctomycetes bacterium]|nr:hypothetical protein [Planctomycetota bacterium]
MVDNQVRVFDQLLYSPPKYGPSRYFGGHFLQAAKDDVVVRGTNGRVVRVAPEKTPDGKPVAIWQSQALADPQAIALCRDTVIIAGRKKAQEGAAEAEEFAVLALRLDDGRGDPLEATYKLDGTTIVATAKQEGEELSEQRLDLPKNWDFVGPFSAFEFCSTAVRDLKIGDKTTFNSVGFGFPSWRLVVTEVQAQRHEDRPVTLESGKKFEARYYTSEFTIPIGKFAIETWTDQHGITIKSTIKMPFGVVTVELE